MNEEIEAQGRKVVELFQACAAAPDDLAVAAEADDALRALESLLVASGGRWAVTT